MIERPILNNLPSSSDDRRSYFANMYGQIFGWIADLDQLFMCGFLPEFSNQFNYQLRIVEIGVFAGSTTRGLIIMTGGIAVGIDNFSDFEGEGRRSLNNFNSGKDIFWYTIKESGIDLSDHIKELIVDDSKNVGERWSNPIDILFVDGDHHYEQSKSDIQLFSRYIIPGGIILVDDWNMETVRKAVSECLFNDQWDCIRVPVEDGSGGKMFCAKRIK